MIVRHRLKAILLRMRALLRSDQPDRELGEEIGHHVQLKTEEYVAKGFTLDQAKTAALRDFGGVDPVMERCRDARGANWIRDLGMDLRYGIRMLPKNPGFAATME
jgi:hypothetical protein